MVTQPSTDRFEGFLRSVACYRKQTWPNRELVVVLDQGSVECVERIKSHLADSAILVHPPGKHSLGALRNLSVAAANGEVLCQWDDDDLSHPMRLSQQYQLLCQEEAIAVGFQETMHFFPRSRELFWLNFRSSPNGCHVGTVMFRRGLDVVYPETGPTAHKGEDTVLFQRLVNLGKVAFLTGLPYLYIYVFHGANTFAEEHHRMLTQRLGISRGLLQRRRSAFDHLDGFDLGEGPIAVFGNNGLAFQIRSPRLDGVARQGEQPNTHGQAH